MSTTMSERFVKNFFTIMIARIAMIVTPFILAAGGWVVAQLYLNHDSRITAVEAAEAKHAAQLQDHESRLVFGVAQSEIFQKAVSEKFSDIGATLKDLGTQITTMNGSIIRLQTTIENRLPPRSSKLEPEPQPQQ